ncbi:cyclophilin-like fold protein [Streptomyces sp. Tue6028]|uniref:cyclophilin-like fold protein n=1 Tax=Streptomyces sp. Tue6028 TaxID=2036037 RepID=UPI003EBF39B4
MEKIEVMLDEHDFTVELNDNKTVDSLLRHLPMDITVGEDGGQRYYGPTPTPLPVDGAPATSSPRRGDLYYSKFWNAGAIFYGNGKTAPFVLVHLGDVQEDGRLLNLSKYQYRVTIKPA